MKYINQFLIILAVSFVGEIIHAVVPLPIPASIYGLVLMFLCLTLKIFPVAAVKETGNFFVEIMPLMFVPAAVGLLVYWEELKSMLLPVILTITVLTVIIMAVSGVTTQAVIRAERRHKARKEERENG